MDGTLENMMKKHLEGSAERETEIALMKQRLCRGDYNFQELQEQIKDMSDNIKRIIFLLDGCKDQQGIIAKVNEHDRFFQRFFGAIGFLTFMGITTIGITIFYVWQWIKHKVGGL